ncbi:MAG: glycosyltransferase family 2 protein [Nitrospirae bacterium]|nr:glycosyltransferase family 2 protein [Nitrospirota bacterium]
MKNEKHISVIIPNSNGASTIGKCLESILSSRYKNFEVVVVDDCSRDNSVEIIKGYPCRLVQIDRHLGASNARNIGVQNSRGEILFFVDADCLLQRDTLALADIAFSEDRNRIIGGTYTKIPYDDDFFSTFQSIFINYSETKHRDRPDYIATHAMIIDKQIFRDNGGFKEGFFLPILEDVEFTHRLRKADYRLIINPEILVQHIFSFSLLRSLQNAARKSMYWTIYSIRNHDLLKDSGTASVELKINVLSYFFTLLFVFIYLFSGVSVFFITIPFILGMNLYLNKRLIKSFYETKGLFFTFFAILYYTMVYPLGVGAGAFAGVLTYLRVFRIRRGLR